MVDLEKRKFIFFRVLLGLYLLIIFWKLLPFGGALFGANSPYGADSSIQPLSIFFYVRTPQTIHLLLWLGLVSSLLLCLGFARRFLCALLWSLWIGITQTLPYLQIPSDPFIGWILLALIGIPDERRLDWKFPREVFWVAWIVFAVAYTFSGIHKYTSQSWSDGSMIMKVLHGSFSRDNFVTLLLREWAPPMLLTALSYFVLWSEILFAPMALWKPTRIAAWITLTGMHLSLLVICNFAHVSAGMLLVHLFLFDVSWIPQQTRASLYARLHNRRLPTR